VRSIGRPHLLLPLLVVAGLITHGCGPTSPTLSAAASKTVAQGCGIYVSMRPLVGDIQALDALIAAGKADAADATRARIQSTIDRLGSLPPYDESGWSARVRDFLGTIPMLREAMAAHLADYPNLPLEGVIDEEEGIIGGMVLLDEYASGSDGGLALCPGLAVGTPFSILSPGS
jgi:hypothetical protein